MSLTATGYQGHDRIVDFRLFHSRMIRRPGGGRGNTYHACGKPVVESRQAMSEPTSSTPSRPPVAVPLSTRLRVALELLLGLRPADLQTARIYADAQFAGRSLAVRWAKLVRWAWHQMWVSIPGVSGDLIIGGKISRTPMWLVDANPLGQPSLGERSPGPTAAGSGHGGDRRRLHRCGPGLPLGPQGTRRPPFAGVGDG